MATAGRIISEPLLYLGHIAEKRRVKGHIYTVAAHVADELGGDEIAVLVNEIGHFLAEPSAAVGGPYHS